MYTSDICLFIHKIFVFQNIGKRLRKFITLFHSRGNILFCSDIKSFIANCQVYLIILNILIKYSEKKKTRFLYRTHSSQAGNYSKICHDHLARLKKVNIRYETRKPDFPKEPINYHKNL